MRNKLILLGLVLVLLSSFGLGDDCSAKSTTPTDYFEFNDTGVDTSGAYVEWELREQVDPGEIFCMELNITIDGDNEGNGLQLFGDESKSVDDWVKIYQVSNNLVMNLFTDIRTLNGYGVTDVNYAFRFIMDITNKNGSLQVSHDTDTANWSTINDSYIYVGGRSWNDGFDFYRSNGDNNGLIVDEIYVYDCTTGQALRPGCTAGAPPSPTDSLNISNPAPPNLSSFNVNVVNFNLTVNASFQFNASLYINGTLNQTTDNWSAGTDVEVKFNVTFLEDASHTYQIRVFDNDIRENTSIVEFFMDFEEPIIQTNYVDYSIYFANNLTTQFNFTDNILLHSINISIDDKLILDEQHVHNTTYQYNLTWNIQNYTVGIHNITVRVADGHTAFELAEAYDWSNGLFNDYMKYTFSNGGFVKTELKNPSIFDTWTTKRLFDRYTQTLEPSNPSDTIVLVEESNQKIHIANKVGKYKGQWLIIGDKWKDYVLKNEPTSVVSIKRINDYKVEVTISGIKNKDTLEFESIGDLNVITQVFPFVVVNSSVDYTSPILETQDQAMTLVLNKTTGVSTAAELFYNGTSQTVTKTPFTNYDSYSSSFTTISIDTVQENVTFFWQYAFTGDGNNDSGNLTFNQTTNSVNFDNCTSFTTNVINFTVKNESSGNAILTNGTTIDGFFKVWTSSEAVFSEFNLTWGPPVQDGEFALCVDTISGNFTFDAQMEYDAVGFSSKLYYFNNYVVDSTADFIDLFLTEGTTAVTLTVKDFDDSIVEGAVIKVLSYDIATDTSTTTEIVETDSNGEAVVQLILNTQFYVFIVEVDGVIKLQTSPTKISTTTKTLRIDLSDIKYFDRYDVTRGITHSLTNASNLITFTWSDPSGDIADACLMVDRTTINNAGKLLDVCVSSTAGTITYNINETFENNTYKATSYVKFSTTEIYNLKTIYLNFASDSAYKKFGLTGIFVAFLLTLTLIGVGIWHPVIAVLLGILGLSVSIILGIFYVEWGALVGLIIMGGILLYKLTKN